MAKRTHTQFTNSKGFSLIEIIMVLVLLGIMGALSSLGISSFIGTFSQIKQSNDIVTAGQIAILRIAKELIAVQDLDTDSNATRIKFTSHHIDGNYTIEISQSGDALLFKEAKEPSNVTSDDILVESVDSIGFEYYVWDSDTTNPFQLHDPLWTNDRCSISIDKARFDNDANTTTFEITSNPANIPTNHLKIKFDNDTNSTDTSTPGDNETFTFNTITPDDVCQYAYVYDPNRENKTMCFFKIAITGDAGNSTSLGCNELPQISSINYTGHTITRIIKVTLKMQAYDTNNPPYELSIMVSPRNIE